MALLSRSKTYVAYPAYLFRHRQCCNAKGSGSFHCPRCSGRTEKPSELDSICPSINWFEEHNRQDSRESNPRAAENQVAVWREYIQEYFDKLVSWVRKSIAIGDNIITQIPLHTILPWTALRFMLQVMSALHTLMCVSSMILLP